jgi:NAD(P)-dependent dehydrogenase (short-subunit alcohol dehydrogenase family)
MGHDRLTGRSALISGVDSGIGRAVVLCFAKEGADILFTFLEAAGETVAGAVRVARQGVTVALRAVSELHRGCGFRQQTLTADHSS